MNPVAKNLKILRELYDYTQDYVADYLGISQNTYSLMERGETKITIDRLEHLSGLHKMDIADLLKYSDAAIIHNLNDNKGVGICTHEVTVNNGLLEEERQSLYKIIEKLEEENGRLIKIIEGLSAKPQ